VDTLDELLQGRSALCPCMPPAQRDAAIDQILALVKQSYRIEVLPALLPYLTPAQAEKAAHMLQEIRPAVDLEEYKAVMRQLAAVVRAPHARAPQ
jgi:hypothetical protein